MWPELSYVSRVALCPVILRQGIAVYGARKLNVLELISGRGLWL